MGIVGLGVPVEELSSRHQLQDERDLRGRLEDLLQLDLKGTTGGMQMQRLAALGGARNHRAART